MDSQALGKLKVELSEDQVDEVFKSPCLTATESSRAHSR